MKYLYLVAIFFLLSMSIRATHIVGGDLHYECLGGNQYKIVLKVYRDCINGISGFDNPASVGVFNAQGLLVLNVQIPLNNNSIETLPLDTGDPCLDPPTGVCVERAIYEQTVILDVPAGGLTLTYQRRCRNSTIVNCASFDNLGITITTQIPDPSLAVCNSNPAFNSFPPVFICMNQPLYFDHSATDADGDSLVYTFCNPLLTNVPGNYINPPGAPPYPLLQFYPQYNANYPIDSSPAFSIDPQTGLLTGTPIQLGQYVVGVCVEEYRNGVLLSTTNRDFQFNIAICSQDIVAAFNPSPPCQGLELSFNNTGSGETFYWDFGVPGTDADVSTLSSPVFSFPEPGVYEVTLVANPGFGCADTMLIMVPAFNAYEAELTYNPECTSGGWSYDFDLFGNFTSSDQFNWALEWDSGLPGPEFSSTIQNPQNVMLPPGTDCQLAVVVSNGYCELSLTELLAVPDSPTSVIAPQTAFCSGLTVDFSIATTNTPGGPFLWNFGDPGTTGDVSTLASPSYTYTQYGTYTVSLQTAPGDPCATTATAQVVVLPPDPLNPSALLSEPDICDDESELQVTYTGSGQTSFYWLMGDGSTQTANSFLYEYAQPGNYTITLVVENALCELEESLVLEASVGFGPVDAPMLIPNVFTPNHDSQNDRFRAFYAGESTGSVLPNGTGFFDYLSYYHMRIYNRWGNMVFDSDGEAGKSWDGTYHGEVSEGVYYYITDIQRKCLDEKPVTHTGTVTVLRK